MVTAGYGQQIVSWQFSSPETTGQEAVVHATNKKKGIKSALLARGKGIEATVPYKRGFYSNVFSGSKSKPGTRANAINKDEFLQIEIGIEAKYKVSLTGIGIRIRRSGSGPTTGSWQYSLDGKNFSEISEADFALVSVDGDKEGINQPVVDLSEISDLQNIKGKKTVILRLYLWGAKTNTGSILVGRYGTNNTRDKSLFITGTVEK